MRSQTHLRAGLCFAVQEGSGHSHCLVLVIAIVCGNDTDLCLEMQLICLLLPSRGMGSDFIGLSDSSSFVHLWQVKMHFQILLRSFSDCCTVYEINQQIVFVFPIGRSLRLMSIIWEKKN